MVVGEQGSSVGLGAIVVDPPGEVVGGTRVLVVGTNVVLGEPVVVGPPGTLVRGAPVVVGHGPTPPPGSGQAPTVVVGPVVAQPNRWRRATRA